MYVSRAMGDQSSLMLKRPMTQTAAAARHPVTVSKALYSPGVDRRGGARTIYTCQRGSALRQLGEKATRTVAQKKYIQFTHANVALLSGSAAKRQSHTGEPESRDVQA